jgi:hypothetical protein
MQYSRPRNSSSEVLGSLTDEQMSRKRTSLVCLLHLIECIASRHLVGPRGRHTNGKIMFQSEITLSMDEESHRGRIQRPHVNPSDMTFWHHVRCDCLKRLASLIGFLGSPAFDRD